MSLKFILGSQSLLYLHLLYLHLWNECLGAYTWTADDQTCSDIGKQALSDEDECKLAAASHNAEYKNSGCTHPPCPTGCIEDWTGGIRWNRNEDGRRNKLFKAICKDIILNIGVNKKIKRYQNPFKDRN